MIFLHLFNSSKITAGLTASLLDRQPGGPGIELGHLQVGEDFTLQFPLQTPLAN
jgi:hypothetical protein